MVGRGVRAIPVSVEEVIVGRAVEAMSINDGAAGAAVEEELLEVPLGGAITARR